MESIQLQNRITRLSPSDTEDSRAMEYMRKTCHEIRNYLTGICGWTDLLIETEQKNLQKEYLLNLKKSLFNFQDFINSTLRTDCLEEGFDVSRKDAIKTCSFFSELERYVSAINKKDITFTCTVDNDFPPYIHSDRIRLSQVFYNLLSNAIKFTHEGTIHLHARCISSYLGHNYLKFEISDSGQGIENNRLSSLFSARLKKEKPAPCFEQGLGLGLSICKDLVMKLGGEIGVISSKKKGSTFWFTITSIDQPEEELH